MVGYSDGVVTACLRGDGWAGCSNPRSRCEVQRICITTGTLPCEDGKEGTAGKGVLPVRVRSNCDCGESVTVMGLEPTASSIHIKREPELVVKSPPQLHASATTSTFIFCHPVNEGVGLEQSQSQWWQLQDFWQLQQAAGQGGGREVDQETTSVLF